MERRALLENRANKNLHKIDSSVIIIQPYDPKGLRKSTTLYQFYGPSIVDFPAKVVDYISNMAHGVCNLLSIDHQHKTRII